MSPLKRALAVISLVALAVAACTDRNDRSVFDPDTGHPADFVADHGESYARYPASCTECHGQDLRGGIAGVSCFLANRGGQSCHALGPQSFIHPDGFGNPRAHGPVANAAPGPTTGLAVCKVCHGADFSGGAVNTPCSRCHGVPAPHPRKWFGPAYSHTNADQGNAPVCADCHRKPGTGGTPGCFNNTLCHAQRGVHPSGFEEPRTHGPVAKAAPGDRSGFAWCQGCHGDEFTGGTSGVSCVECHEVEASHPREWQNGDPFTHTNTNQGNAPVCADCHSSAAGAPGCFNGTLCHTQRGVHPDGWGQPGKHGVAAKKPPGSMTGFTTCQSCHGASFGGGSAGVGCFGCHGVNAPHSPEPWTNGTTTHTNTSSTNQAVCGACHRKPDAVLPSGCFNDTLCHAGA